MSSIYDEIRRIAKIRNVSMKYIAEVEIGLSWETVRKWNRFEPNEKNRKTALSWLSKQKISAGPVFDLGMTKVSNNKGSGDVRDSL